MLRFGLILTVLVASLFGASHNAIASSSAGDIKPAASFEIPTHSFEECCPEPVWWNSVEAPVIASKSEMLKIWQNRGIAKRKKARMFYQAMKDFDGKDDDIVATAISLYGYVDRDYPHRTKMLEFGASRFFMHRRSLEGYSGMTGDTSAGLVRKLAKHYMQQGRADNAVAVISRLVALRENEINQQMLEHLSLAMIDALKMAGRNEEAFSVASYAIANYQGDWEKNLVKKKEALRSAVPIHRQVILAFPAVLWMTVAGVALLLFVMVSWLMHRRSGQSSRNDVQFRFGRNGG